ncbi:MAG: hypothetical protein AAF208_10525 [Cyanobacteria bacterium P01_A01_bin.45]
MQDQINLVARIEKSMLIADPNRIRVVRGQLFHQSKLVERFIGKYRKNSSINCKSTNKFASQLKVEVSSSPKNVRESQQQIYCALNSYNQGLLKMSPILDRLLSRRGESAMVRRLPLVNGERVFHPVLSLSQIQKPLLRRPATPFATLEPNLNLPFYETIGSKVKKSLSNYNQPLQPAIAQPPETFAIFDTLNNNLNLAKSAFPSSNRFQDPRETDAALNSFTYKIDSQELQTYAKFLEIPSTGIFRVLHHHVYQRKLNHLQNRLLRSSIKNLRASDGVTLEHQHNDLFPTLNKSKSGFISILPLQLVNGLPSDSNSTHQFGILGKGIDYNFMIDIGDISLENLDASLKKIPPQIRNFILSYQPPKQLYDLQVDQRRFFTGKYPPIDSSFQVLATAPAKLNHTYLVRTFQFQLPEIIARSQVISQRQRGYLDQLLKMQSSDIIVAFRPVRRRSDGSYTVLWRVIKHFDNPVINDLEKYVKYY